MHYFSIHTQQCGHLGFFVMLADDGAEAGPKGGRFAVKLQSENPSGGPQADMLCSLEQEGKPLLWRVEKDRVELFCGGRNIGSIRNEYLTLLGHSLVLNDLTGTI